MWGYFFAPFEVNWVMLHRVVFLLIGQCSFSVFNLAPLCLLLLLCKERNSCTFEDVEVLEV